jgi:hypothetical protein
VFRKYGLINGKIDGLNGVFFCHECHQYYDNGHWNWTIQDAGECGSDFSHVFLQNAGITLAYLAHLQNKIPPSASCPGTRLANVARLFLNKHCPNLANLAQLSDL